MIKKIIAFTLAEVLLVSGIVAVIGALTVPNLKKGHDRKVYATKAKAAFAKLDAALQNVDMSKTLAGYSGQSQGVKANRSLAVHNEMIRYLKLKANCNLQSDSNYCFSKNDIRVKEDGHKCSGSDNFGLKGRTNCTTAIMNDNTEFALCMVAGEGGLPSSSWDNIGYFGFIVVDVDGANKGPNARGQDIYLFFITDSGLMLPPDENDKDYEPTVFKTGVAIDY
ncbi:hypothetical protein IJ843_06645 [bacterium]|nr:hypothetical protein [bacterium]